jgi:hypothetical protein
VCVSCRPKEVAYAEEGGGGGTHADACRLEIEGRSLKALSAQD